LEIFDVIVLGGGASGLMAAFTAAQRNRRVLVLDSSNKIGKKILMSGGGRCNFTNYDISAENYLCHNPHFVKSALSQYTQWDFIAMVERYGINYHERDHGQLFCDNSAKEILAMLQKECDQAGVDIRARTNTESVSYNDAYFLNTSAGKFKTQSLIVATGGLSIPTLGVSAFGYDIAAQFGHQLFPRVAGLVPFTFSDWFKSVSEKLSGLAIKAELSTKRKSFTENLLFTHRGLSGPVVLQLSNYWQPGDEITINLLADIDCYSTLLNDKNNKPKAMLKNVLSVYLPASLVNELGEHFWSHLLNKSMAEISNVELDKIANTISQLTIKPSGTEGYRTAEVTLGGVDTAEISSKTLESQRQPGLFFVGEVLDVTGHLGGYNFQWAWSSGYVAGLHA